MRTTRTVKRLTVHPRASSGLKCPPGTTGVVSSDTDEYGIWDAAITVQDDSTVDIVFANASRTDIKLHTSSPIGYLQLIDPSEGKQLDDPGRDLRQPSRGARGTTQRSNLGAYQGGADLPR